MVAITSQLKELAADVHLSELLRAVRKGSGSAEVQQWLSHCSLEALNSRCAPHGFSGPFALSAPPLWLACYRGDHASVQALLQSGECAVNAVSCACPGAGRPKGCALGGQSVLHVAASRGASDAVRRLLGAGVDACAPCCFSVSEDDEPEWDEQSQEFSQGLAGLSALQLAALRSDDALCSLLLAHGADAAALRTLPNGASVPAALAPKLAPLLGDDGEPLECPICYDALVRLTSVWTPCCCRPFHEHCLKGQRACPLCRAPLHAAGGGGGAPRGDAELAAAVAAAQQAEDVEAAGGGGGAPHRRAHNSLRSTANHERALDLAFSGPQWGSDTPQSSGMGSYNSAVGSNYGWRGLSRGPV